MSGRLARFKKFFPRECFHGLRTWNKRFCRFYSSSLASILQGTAVHSWFFNIYPHWVSLRSWLQPHAARYSQRSQHSFPRLQALGHWDAGQPCARSLGIMPSLLTKEKDTSVSQAEERREGNPFGTGTKTIMRVVMGVGSYIWNWWEMSWEHHGENHQFLDLFLALWLYCAFTLYSCCKTLFCVSQRALCQPMRSCLWM